jgi:hypothetical protein
MSSGIDDREKITQVAKNGWGDLGSNLAEGVADC